MSQNSTQPKISFTALGMAIGLVIGGIIGLLIDSTVISAGGGMILGLAVGAALDNRNKG